LTRPELRGLVGTVEWRYGFPDYPALNARLEGGRLVLFWANELEEAL
jgi:hypothetical protein